MNGYQVGRDIISSSGLETKVTILGHIQRGGSPSALILYWLQPWEQKQLS